MHNKNDYEDLLQNIHELAGPKSIDNLKPKIEIIWGILFFLFSLLPISINLIVREIGNLSFTKSIQPNWNYPFIVGVILLILFFLFFVVAICLYNKWPKKYGHTFSQFFPQIPKSSISINPSTIEFEKSFSDILKKTIGKNDNNKLIVVIDNIDRIEPQNARNILNTLQAFIDKDNDYEYEDKKLFNRVWVIIPYDLKSISRIWEPIDIDEREKFVKAFLHKRFQTIFSVPPLITSNWKNFFLDRLHEEFPKHNNDDQFHAIYESYRNCERNNNQNPNPRDIIRFINQLGTYHIIWEDRISLEDITFYVCNILYTDGDPAKTLNDILDYDQTPEEIKENLLALYYDLEPKMAFEVHFASLLPMHLEKQNYKSIEDYHGLNNDGFWTVVNELDFNNIAENNKISQLSFISRILREFHDNKVVITRIKTKLIKSIKKVRDWSSLEPEQMKSLNPLFEDMTKNQIQEVFNSFANVPWINDKLTNETPATEIRDGLLSGWYLGINEFVKFVKEKKLTDTVILDLPFNDKGLFEFITVASTYEEIYNNWSCFKTNAKPDSVTKAIIERITSDSLIKSNITVYSVCEIICRELNWNEIVDAISPKLILIDGQRHQIDILLPLLIKMKNQVTKALSLLEQFSETHSPFYLLQLTNNNSNDSAWLIFAIINFSNGQYAPAGSVLPDTQKGVELINDIFKNPINHLEVIKNYANIVLKYSNAKDFFTVIETLGSKLFLYEVLRILLSQEKFNESLTPELFFTNWKAFKEVSVEKYTEFLIQIDLINLIVNSHFSEENNDLYLDIVSHTTIKNKKIIRRWLSDHFNQFSENDWTNVLNSNTKTFSLITNINTLVEPIKFGFPFSNSIELIIKSVIEVNNNPETFLKNWPILKHSYRDHKLFTASMQRVIKYLIDSQICCSEIAINNFGEDFNDLEVLTCHREIVPNLFSRIVREDDTVGLKWMVNIFAKYPHLLNSISGRNENHELKVRIFEKSEKTESSEVRDYLKQIIKVANWRRPVAMDLV